MSYCIRGQLHMAIFHSKNVMMNSLYTLRIHVSYYYGCVWNVMMIPWWDVKTCTWKTATKPCEATAFPKNYHSWCCWCGEIWCCCFCRRNCGDDNIVVIDVVRYGDVVVGGMVEMMILLLLLMWWDMMMLYEALRWWFWRDCGDGCCG